MVSGLSEESKREKNSFNSIRCETKHFLSRFGLTSFPDHSNQKKPLSRIQFYINLDNKRRS